jgi:hypothetical protein
MKRISIIIALLLVMPHATANEIAGTRVSGQGAVCAEGQGKAVEINVTTKEETSYCYEREPIPLPTQEQLEAKAQEVIAEKLTQQNNADAPTNFAETTVTAEPEVITETLTKVEINVSTGVVTVSEFTEAEKQQLAKDRAVETARQTAKTEAQTASLNNVGVRQCVNWQAEGQSGSECAFEPIPATEEEVAIEFNALKFFFDANWLDVLLAWLW